MYKTCERCGCSLDPGETCNCEVLDAEQVVIENELSKIRKIQDSFFYTPLMGCPRCGDQETMDREIKNNPFSKYANIRICKYCSMDEEINEAEGDPLPLADWHFASKFKKGVKVG